ncbi:LOW QUALITY PROTEIN: NAD(P)(+)--arginine ADP-ribosyltransferase 2-like [Trichomycterus rosablanca]|uniref:LOW QUALITY PROTEIN: NAD(P)(+)--arginine ADP-ribosyltransferase 2-like n=1 Tax=Trichomycterus rosablanca TaxID=2290929 RepID=UPI002F35F0C1
MSSFFWQKQPIKLDMESNSVDDQYEWCESLMRTWSQDHTLKNESNSSEDYTNVWKIYRNITDINEQIMKMYTANDFFMQFNAEVSTGRTNYMKDFPYKAFHYLLTRAVQKFQLNECTEVFRRVDISFVTNVTGREMRFSRFASTSLKTDLYDFGNASCFQIYTCFGANIDSFSLYPEEQEVLIPPYETFKITNVTENHESCDVLYTLQSTGRFSKMNCHK